MNRLSHFLSAIVLLFSLLTSGGCQVLRIPSYRADCGAFPESQLGGAACDQECPPGFLPPLAFPAMPAVLASGVPVPGWWADWRARQDLPEAPPYPRFHPLPTRPMFSPHPAPVGQMASPWGSVESLSSPMNYAMPVPSEVVPSEVLPAPAPLANR